MATEENKAVARRFVEVLQEFFRTGDANLMDSVLADNVVQHISGLPPEGPRGGTPSGNLWFCSGWRTTR